MNEILNSNIFIKNEYYYKYIDLINTNLNTNSEKFKTQKHHIIPRKFYYFLKKEVDNTNSNLVYLLYKDHILAHYYLALCTDGVYKKVNEEALLFLINQKLEDIDRNELNHYQELYEDLCRRKSENLMGSIVSEETRRKISESTKGKIVSEETRNKISLALRGDNNPMKHHIMSDEEYQRRCEANKRNGEKRRGIPASEESKLKNSLAHKGENHPNWGKHLSDETRKKISESNKGKKWTEEQFKKQREIRLGKPNYKARGKKRNAETKLKFKEIQKDRIWYTYGKEDLHLKVNDVVPEGFYPGRSKAVSENGIHNKGKVCYNNGSEQIYILEEDIEKYIQLGYKKGGLPRKRNK